MVCRILVFLVVSWPPTLVQTYSEANITWRLVTPLIVSLNGLLQVTKLISSVASPVSSYEVPRASR